MFQYKFAKDHDVEFVRALKLRVNAYFESNGINRKSNLNMKGKTVLSIAFYLGVYLIIISGMVQAVLPMFLLWGLMGLGQALIGMNIMHDTVHGSFSQNKWVNLVLQIPIVLIGVESRIWRIEHNVLHHTYTNIESVDQDIHPRYVFRFSRNQPKRWFHRFQHIYAPFMYCLLLIEWLSFKDFVKVIKYYKIGMLVSRKEAVGLAVQIAIKKALFYMIFLVLPIYLLPYNALTVLLMFLSFLAVAGLIMTVIFQTAHVVPETSFVNQKQALISENWHVHQMKTTANFATKNKLVTFLLGGLNFQIEHHLFPHICHIHYPKISDVVQRTAEEFGIPYLQNDTMWDAVYGHFKLLRSLGRAK